jgi:GxxExxY protein
MAHQLRTRSPLPAKLESLATEVLDCCFCVHKAMGPGLLEAVYEHCLLHELTSRQLHARRQVALPVMYKGTRIESGYRIDILVENSLVVELKSVAELLPIHQAQLSTYLRLSGCRVGFLVNFNVTLFKSGVRRIVM